MWIRPEGKTQAVLHQSPPVPGHPVAYGFDGYLDARAAEGDPILSAWLDRVRLDAAARAWLAAWGKRVATEFDAWADDAERPEDRPRLAGKGAHDRDEPRIVLPAATARLLAEAHGSGLWRPNLPEAARYAAVYLLNQNGEAGATCSVACTDGLRRILRRFPAGFETALRSVEESTPQRFAHGAQFVTEIQGGSDAATNAVRAEPQADGSFRLWGQKWFCSNPTADWWLVTARPDGAPAGPKGVGLFLVSRDAGSYRFERLKDKLGTRALPTAEIQFEGAPARPVGPLPDGLKNMVATVLVTSRIHNVLAAAAFLRRAEREARAYAAFRTAFGSRLADMPLIADALSRLASAADRTEAGAFATVDAWLAADRPGCPDAERLHTRVLVSLAKAVVTRGAPGLIYEAMTVLGGNGIEERFSPLPRLWRDSAILETWEGSYTLLLMQALDDLRRFVVRGHEAEFLGGWHGRPPAAEEARELAAVLAAPDGDAAAILRWRELAHRLYGSWEARALLSLQPQTTPPSPRRG